MTGSALSPAQFGAHFEEARRTLWYIAAAILNDRTQAHDVVQEAATIAMGKLAEFDAATSFTAWMAQIVRFVALNEARRRQRQSASLRDHGSEVGGGGSGPARPGEAPPPPDDMFDSRVASVLSTLEETARACLLLRAVHGMAYSEIARALDIPEGTAMSHVHRARTALRERLGGASASRAEGRPA